jgi:transposase
VKLGKSATETLEMLCEAFGEHSLSQTAVFEWHSRFKAGQLSVEDDEQSGRPSTSKTTENVEKVREIIHEDHRRTTHELTDIVLFSHGVCQEIITENLNMRHISAKFVPRLLTDDQSSSAYK